MDEAEGEIWQSKKICFSWLAAPFDSCPIPSLKIDAVFRGKLSSNSSSNLEISAVGENEKLIRKDERRKDLEVICHSGLNNLRRRNTRYKNPQLVAQHCFVASFRRCFPFFTLHDQLEPKTFVASWRNAARWLVDLLGHEQICCATSCQFDEKRATKPKFVAQSRPAPYFSQQLSSTRNKCFCCGSSWSRKVKNGKHRPKLATKQCCATSWGFLYLVFRRLYATWSYRYLKPKHVIQRALKLPSISHTCFFDTKLYKPLPLFALFLRLWGRPISARKQHVGS